MRGRSGRATPAGRGGVLLKLREERVRLAKGGCQDLARHLKKLKYARILRAVVDAGALPATLDEALPPQRPEVLRGAARVEAQRGLKLAHRAFAVAQKLEDAHAHRVAERAEKFGLDDVYWAGGTLPVGHGHWWARVTAPTLGKSTTTKSYKIRIDVTTTQAAGGEAGVREAWPTRPAAWPPTAPLVRFPGRGAPLLDRRFGPEPRSRSHPRMLLTPTGTRAPSLMDLRKRVGGGS